MKVWELIRKLSELPPDLEVVVESCEVSSFEPTVVEMVDEYAIGRLTGQKMHIHHVRIAS